MFEDRHAAGKALAGRLRDYSKPAPIVFALPRGGIPVAAAVAEALDTPLDVILVRKLGAPGHDELAIGAIVDGGSPTIVLYKDAVDETGASEGFIEAAKSAALSEIERRRRIFLGDASPASPAGRNIIIIDDGLATGATMEAAIDAMRKVGASHITVAVPVAPAEAAARFRRLADDFICLETPSMFWAVGQQYRNFRQLTDADVVAILKDAARRTSRRGASTQGANGSASPSDRT